jgi:hypothetical protein
MSSSRTTMIQKTKSHHIKYCKIIRKVIKESRKQHYCRLIIISNNKILKKWNIIKEETGKVHLVEQVFTLLVNDGNIQVQTNAAKSLCNFFITITEKLNIQHVEKGDVIHILTD